MFVVTRVMNSAGPGATSVKGERDGKRERRWQEGETETDRPLWWNMFRD